MEKTELPIEAGVDIGTLFGSFDSNIKLIEKALGVKIDNKNNTLQITGDEKEVSQCKNVLVNIMELIKKGEDITEQNVIYALTMTGEDEAFSMKNLGDDCLSVTSKGKPVKAKTLGQKQYTTAIENNTVTFGIGPAGTGKTFLAVACAVTAFRRKEVNRIIITRPAVEAGEKLGFLPGDLQTKVDPYLRPLYDAMFEMFGAETYYKYQEKGLIEVAPLAYMRGRTLDNAFIILDEAQNTTPEQMKMFLTRIGFGSKAVVTGDITQVDLPDGKKSGLREVMRILKNIDDIAFCTLTEKDVIRHPLVQSIIKAYEKYETEKTRKR